MCKLYKWFFRFMFIILFLIPNYAAYAGDILTIATFNCEFLTRPKVHVKFGLKFNLSQEPSSVRQEWSQPGYRDQKFNEAAKAVAEVIHSIDADVIALVEVGDQNDVAELNAEISDLGLEYPHMGVCDSADKKTKQYVAVLSKFPLAEIKDKLNGREGYLGEPDDPETEKDTGISKGMKVSFTAYGKDFILYIVHLASESNGHEKDKQRISQASIVRRHYLPEIKEGKLIIVAGDLNDKRGQPTLNRIRGIDDIHEDLIQTGHVKYFEDDKLDNRWTYQYQGIRQQIDHILLSYAIKDACKRGGIKARTLNHGNPVASDHKPLVVTLKLKD